MPVVTISTELLAPVIVLVAWTMVMWVWLFAVRIPAVQAMKMKFDADMPRGEQMNLLPPRVRWKADNHNHLMEQPTIFYALVISLALLGAGDGTNVALAWTYVGLRVIHSIYQAMINIIIGRFVLFMLSSLVLAVLTIRGLLLVL